MKALRWTVRGAGILALLLGLALWSGRGASLVGLHQGLGMVAVVALCVLAVLALRSGGRAGLAVGALVWGLLTPLFGVVQTRLLTGEGHWIIQAVHLLLGLGVVALGEGLASGAGRLAPLGRTP